MSAHQFVNRPGVAGCGALRGGRRVRLGRPVPMTNLYMAMLRRAGVQVEKIGDSTGELEAV